MSEDILPEAYATEFPRGQHAEIIWNVRNCIYDALNNADFKMIGAGISVGADDEFGSADVQIETADGLTMIITISLKKPRQ